MAYETIEFEIKEHVALITLNREEDANALNVQMADELMDAAIRCDTEKNVRAVLITARGKMFCAGGDLKVFSEAGNEVGVLAKKITTSLHAAVSRFARMAPPLVVAVNGTVAGGGLSLVLVADMVLSARSAKFTLAYTRAGLVPDGSSTYFLPRLVGLRRAKELIFTNRVLNAEEALDWQLINQVLDDELLQDEVNTESTANLSVDNLGLSGTIFSHFGAQLRKSKSFKVVRSTLLHLHVGGPKGQKSRFLTFA